MSDPKNHHYIPASYLNFWGSPHANQKYKSVQCFGLAPNGHFLSSSKSTKSLCSKRHLYTRVTNDNSKKLIIEKDFFSKLENDAIPLLNHIIKFGIDDLSEKQKHLFTSFFLSFELRSPENIERIKRYADNVLREEFSNVDFIKTYPKFEAGRSGFPSTPIGFLEKYHADIVANFGIDRIPNVISGIGNDIFHRLFCELHWFLIDFSDCEKNLLTSDYPFYRSCSLESSDCICAIPLTPCKAFFGVRNIQKYCYLVGQSKEKILDDLNLCVVAQAQDWVIGTDNKQMQFIKNNFGKHRKKYDF